MGEPPAAANWRLRSGSGEGLIPDELLIDIINRLSINDVMRWRCVSKNWKDVITPTIPTILVEDDAISNSVHLMDNWWDPQPIKDRFDIIFPKYDHENPFSHGGLLVMKKDSDFVILNPLNRQQVRIILRRETYPYVHVYGIFWHPNLKEYCIIFLVNEPNVWIMNSVPNTVYHIVNLGPNPRCREVKNVWNHRIAETALSEHYSPVLVGNYLCKEVILIDGDGDDAKSILEFDIMTEEFKLIAPPLELVRIKSYETLNLVNIDGHLSCVRIGVNNVDLIIGISIWTLRDHESQTWVCRNYNITCQVCPDKEASLRAIDFVNGKLVVSSSVDNFVDGKLVVLDEVLYICDLQMGTSKFFHRNNASYLKLGIITIRHGMSLASLANCKSEIRLDIGPPLEFLDIGPPLEFSCQYKPRPIPRKVKSG